MRQAFKSGPGRGAVVLYTCDRTEHPLSHENLTRRHLAQRLALLKGMTFAGEFDPDCAYPGKLYFVPTNTLNTQEAQRLGIAGEHDLFGGVVPLPFVATKTITHGLPHTSCACPDGWSHRFCDQVTQVVLPGFTVFSHEDARSAGLRMLAEGAVRLKRPGGIGGSGQVVVTNAAGLDAELEGFHPAEIAQEGLVLERNLTQMSTLSIGQVRVDDMLLSYYGVQRLTRNNKGGETYGGSTLEVVKGDFDALLQRRLSREVRIAAVQAQAYHTAALACFPGMVVSRSNYDIAQGLDDSGQWRSGVLEQSWRAGGASGAEMAALEAFAADPAIRSVRASTVEVFGERCGAMPADAVIYYQGTDADAGPLTKYARIESYGYE